MAARIAATIRSCAAAAQPGPQLDAMRRCAAREGRRAELAELERQLAEAQRRLEEGERRLAESNRRLAEAQRQREHFTRELRIASNRELLRGGPLRAGPPASGARGSRAEPAGSRATEVGEDAACSADVTARLMSGMAADFRVPPDIPIQDLRSLIASKLPVPLRMQRIVVGAEEVKWPHQWAPIASGASATGQRIEITVLCRSGLEGSWTSERCNIKLVIDGLGLTLKHGRCPGSTFAARQSARILRRRLGIEKTIDITMIADGHFQADQDGFTCDLRLTANGLALHGTVGGSSHIFKRDE